MHSKEWFSICAMVFVVLKGSIFVFEDNCKHLFLELDSVYIKVYIMILLIYVLRNNSYCENTYNINVLWNEIVDFWETPGCVVWLKKEQLCI